MEGNNLEMPAFHEGWRQMPCVWLMLILYLWVSPTPLCTSRMALGLQSLSSSSSFGLLAWLSENHQEGAPHVSWTQGFPPLHHAKKCCWYVSSRSYWCCILSQYVLILESGHISYLKCFVTFFCHMFCPSSDPITSSKSRMFHGFDAIAHLSIIYF